LALLCFFCVIRVSTTNNLFFFADTREIRKFDNEQLLVVYEDIDQPQALDFKSCQGTQKIHWISRIEGKIRRGAPDGGDIENVISDDVVLPRGIAVDYVGNNIYFSQETIHRGEGRLEVVMCDGQHRKVLRTKLAQAGPLSLDITRG
jgi:hypothetical protein